MTTMLRLMRTRSRPESKQSGSMAKGTNITDVFGSSRSSNQLGRVGRRVAASSAYQHPDAWDPISICKPRKAWHKRTGRKVKATKSFKAKCRTLKDDEPLRVIKVDKGTHTPTVGPVTDDCCIRQQQPMSAGNEVRDLNQRSGKHSFNQAAQHSSYFAARFAE